jgi:hypothetical protein
MKGFGYISRDLRIRTRSKMLRIRNTVRITANYLFTHATINEYHLECGPVYQGTTAIPVTRKNRTIWYQGT